MYFDHFVVVMLWWIERTRSIKNYPPFQRVTLGKRENVTELIEEVRLSYVGMKIYQVLTYPRSRSSCITGDRTSKFLKTSIPSWTYQRNTKYRSTVSCAIGRENFFALRNRSRKLESNRRSLMRGFLSAHSRNDLIAFNLTSFVSRNSFFTNRLVSSDNVNS